MRFDCYADQAGLCAGAISPAQIAQVGIVAAIVTAFAVIAVICSGVRATVRGEFVDMSPMMLAWHGRPLGCFLARWASV